ncbi:MAG: sulfate adenylyltransferase subunit CysD [bacterium]
MDYLDQLENNSIYIIREAYALYKKVGLLWSMGKDSTTLLWLMKKAFLGTIPCPVIHLDTSYKFQEIYDFRDKYAKAWNLDLIVTQNNDALNKKMGPKQGKFQCCTELKTQALKNFISNYQLKALFLGIRRDEHGIRAKERIVSPRDKGFTWNYQTQPPELWKLYKTKVADEEHLRVHPLLGWRELDIWRYIKRENIPIIPLYLAKNGQRYRSIGCASCCAPVDSQADSIDKIISELQTTQTTERSGRAQDKESVYTMQKLRSLGYM